MKLKKSIDTNLPEGVTWDEIEKGISEGKMDYLINMMSPSVFRYVIDEKDRSKAINKVLKALQKTDPKNANEKYAEKMLDWMKKYAQLILKRL